MFASLKKHLRNYKREIVDDTLVRTTILTLTQSMLTAERTGVTDRQYVDGQNVTVSLTTYGSRIYNVYLAIESLLMQTVKPNRIVLWLDEKEFNDKTIPVSLQKQKARGLEVRYCKNLKSYKKLIPSLQLFPDDAILTVDDDFIYPFDLVERLLNAYRSDPKSVWFVRGNLMTLDGDGWPQPYEQWSKMPDLLPPATASCATLMADGAPLSFPVGCGGILYPPHALHSDTTDEQLFTTLCPTADDIWFKMMSLAGGTRSRLVILETPFAERFLSIPSHSGSELHRINIDGGANDRQMRQVWEHYRDRLRLNLK